MANELDTEIGRLKAKEKLQEQKLNKIINLLKDEVRALKNERVKKFIHFGMIIGYGLLGCGISIIGIYVGKII